MIKRFSVVLVVAVCFLTAPSLFAITRTWTGATNANWSEPTNWSPAGVPDSSDSLIFGTTLSNAMKNDLPPWTRIGPISAGPSSGFILTGNPLILTGPVTGDFTTEWNVDLKMEADVTLPGTAFHGALDLNGHTVTLHAHATRAFVRFPDAIDGTIIGPGVLVLTGTATKFTKPSGFSGTVRVENSCDLNASMPDAEFIVDGELRGSGTVRSLSGLGNIDPGLDDSPRFDTFHTRSLSIDGGYVVNLSFRTPHLSDRVEVTGALRLSGSLFPRMGIVIPGFPLPPVGQEIVIIDNQGTDPVIGTFQGLPEGGLISADGYTLKISYRAGDGNDVSVTNIAFGKVWTENCGSNWSSPCSWLPEGAPVSGEVLDFGANQGHGHTPFNDLPPGFAVGGLSISGFTLEGNPITLLGDVTAGPLGAGLAMPVTLGAPAHIRANFFNQLNMNGQSATFEGLTTIFELDGNGSIAPVSGSLDVARGTFSGTLSGMLVLGDLPNANITGVTHLIGFDAMKLGNVVIDAGGTIEPGNVIHTFPPLFIGTVNAASLALAGTYDCDLDANRSDQLISDGPISLSGPLSVVVRNGGQTVPSFTIIDNRGSMPVTGSFSGLPEGAVVKAGGSQFTITYQGGDGNDVVLLAGVNLSLAQSSIISAFGESFSVSASVTGAASSVAFFEGIMPIGSVVPQDGVATIRIANLSAGAHVITARFNGATATITHNVALGSTHLSLDARSISAQGFNVVANVQAAGEARGVPTGPVSIDIDGARLGAPLLESGAVTISTGVLAPGKHTIAAHYGGDANFASSEAVINVVVAPPRGRSVRH